MTCRTQAQQKGSRMRAMGRTYRGGYTRTELREQAEKNKMSSGKGWFNESHPHALAARGVKLGREKKRSNIRLSIDKGVSSLYNCRYCGKVPDDYIKGVGYVCNDCKTKKKLSIEQARREVEGYAAQLRKDAPTFNPEMRRIRKITAAEEGKTAKHLKEAEKHIAMAGISESGADLDEVMFSLQKLAEDSSDKVEEWEKELDRNDLEDIERKYLEVDLSTEKARKEKLWKMIHSLEDMKDIPVEKKKQALFSHDSTLLKGVEMAEQAQKLVNQGKYTKANKLKVKSNRALAKFPTDEVSSLMKKKKAKPFEQMLGKNELLDFGKLKTKAQQEKYKIARGQQVPHKESMEVAKARDVSLDEIQSYTNINKNRTKK